MQIVFLPSERNQRSSWQSLDDDGCGEMCLCVRAQSGARHDQQRLDGQVARCRDTHSPYCRFLSMNLHNCMILKSWKPRRFTIVGPTVTSYCHNVKYSYKLQSWDPAIEKVATAYAETCPSDHSKGSGYGENLYWTSRSYASGQDGYMKLAVDCVRSWNSECTDMPASGVKPFQFGDWGHYSQVVLFVIFYVGSS